ncbi:MAG: hypothetical protein GX786_06585 [Clostridiales bacterium]|nr:hypothetical protein [Clostridiales bacterium]
MIDIDKKLEQLPEIVDRSLGGIEANPSLRYKILSAAAETKTEEKKKPFFSRFSVPLTAVSACLVLVVIGFTVFPNLFSTSVSQPEATNALLGHSAAGQQEPVLQERTLSQGTMSIGAGSFSSADSLWVSAGDTFPLISMNGKFYRQMNQKVLYDAQLSGHIGSVENFTQEPALASTFGNMSNVVEEGEGIFAVSQLGDGVIAAKVNDSMTLFQRISFAGNAIFSEETLAQTLGFSAEDVLSISLSEVGTISDEAVAQKLVTTLTQNATYASSSLGSGKQVLLFTLRNGITLQMYVDDDVFSACGSWDCPGFSQAFAEAVAAS